MTAQKKNNKAQKLNLTDAALLKGWNVKIPHCSECGTDTKKRYSGTTCSTCYTEKRNARLGIGKNSTESRAKKIENLNNKIQHTELLLRAMKSELTVLNNEK